MPLSAMLLWTNLLAEQTDVPPAMQEGLAAIKHCVDEELALIEVLIDISRIAAGKLQIEPRSTDLAHVLRASVAGLQSVALREKVALADTYDEAVGVVKADAHRLQQVVHNLLTNALKFTPDGGSVSLALRRESDNVVIAVTDNGDGIPAEFWAGFSTGCSARPHEQIAP